MFPRVKSVCLGADCFAFGELLGKAPQVTKGACSRLGPSFVRVPSLRRRSVGPRRTDIHVLTALSPHPCGSAHSASPSFGLHPSRDWRWLNVMCMKIKIKIKHRSKASRLKPVLQSAPIPLEACDFLDDCSHAPRGNTAPDAPRPEDDAHSAGGGDAERHRMHSHAERGDDHHARARCPIVGPASAGKLLIFSAVVQAPQNATWVQAERSSRGVGRAAWMRRERRQGMDARLARAHGARPE